MISTDRLKLRRAQMSDLEDMHAVFSHPKAMRYWSSLPHETKSQTEDFLAAMVNAQPDNSDDFIVEYQGRAIGKAGCWQIGEIGFILHPHFWGKGIAFEALSATIPHAFSALVMSSLKADVDPRNVASLRLLERLGFRETGRAARTFLLGDEWCDSVYLELPRPAQNS